MAAVNYSISDNSLIHQRAFNLIEARNPSGIQLMLEKGYALLFEDRACTHRCK